MSEKETIQKLDYPLTRNLLAEQLKLGGLGKGMSVLVHSSLSSLGWVCGGSPALVLALMDVLGESGNLVMPMHSTSFTEPGFWEDPAVPKEWWQTIRDNTPAFDPAYTPTRGMGAVPACFSNFPNVSRSNHPTSSFSAWGKDSVKITEGHLLNESLGNNSPLGKLYELDAHVLLIGVGHDSNTSLHLSESRIPDFPKIVQGSAIFNSEGKREWTEFNEPDFNSETFPGIGEAYEKEFPIQKFKLGAATCLLMPQRSLVDFGIEYLNKM